MPNQSVGRLAPSGPNTGDTWFSPDTGVWSTWNGSSWSSSTFGVLLKATVTLTAAQIRALHTTSIQIVGAPGVGKYLNPHYVVVSQKFGTTPFGSSEDDADFTLAVGSCGLAFSVIGNNNVDFITAQPLTLASNPRTSLDNQAMAIGGQNDLSGGPILTSSKNAGGTGYAIGDTGLIIGGSEQDSNAAYVVDTVSGGGAVLTYHLSFAGINYRPSTGAATTTSTGSGDGNFTVNVLTVTPGDGTCKVDMYYTVESV